MLITGLKAVVLIIVPGPDGIKKNTARKRAVSFLCEKKEPTKPAPDPNDMKRIYPSTMR
jgi:hypothetical protein